MYIILFLIFEKEKRTFAADRGRSKNLDEKKRKTEANFLLKYKYIIRNIIVILKKLK